MGYEAYLREKARHRLFYIQEYPYDREMLDGILELLFWILSAQRRPILWIAGDENLNLVKGRFMKLDMEHIRYVIELHAGEYHQNPEYKTVSAGSII